MNLIGSVQTKIILDYDHYSEPPDQGCVVFHYFTSGRSWTWPDLGTESRLEWETGENLSNHTTINTSNESTDVVNAARCCKKAVQFRAYFVDSVWQFLMKFVGWQWKHWKIWLKPALPDDMSCGYPRLVSLSMINWMHCSWTGIQQIWRDVWLEPDLVGFP